MKSAYKDRNGRTMSHGDVVRFYFCADLGFWMGDADDDKEDFTEMIDIVRFDGKNWYCTANIYQSAFIWRVNKYCEIIGNVWDNPELVQHFDPDWIESKFMTDKILKSEFIGG